MAFENILVESVEGSVGIITLNRPAVLNAMSFDLNRELREAVGAMEKDTKIRALVITGAGGKAFSSGADIHEMASATPEALALQRERVLSFNWLVANLRMPTIGAINGVAYGAGALLASALDIRIGCERTKFRFLGAQFGRVAGTWSLGVMVGWAKAKELLYTGRVVEVEEAAQMGLLNRLVPSDQLRDAAVEMGLQIAKNIPECVEEAKRLLNQQPGRSWQEMHDAENAVMAQVQLRPIAVGFAEFLSRKDHG